MMILGTMDQINEMKTFVLTKIVSHLGFLKKLQQTDFSQFGRQHDF